MTIKKFLLLSFSILLLAVACAVLVFTYLQYQMMSATHNGTTSEEVGSTPKLADTTESTTTTTANAEIVPESAAETDTVGIPLNTLPLTDLQKAMLSQFNIDYDTFIITPIMIECAKGKIGSDRFDEIVAGAAPSFTESTSLFACTR